ncbi:MAG: septum formation initiator family protein [Lachnospiraceae bacterium]|nr:septum formation initiator family protein [Lachnospiraceae bacterium]MDE6185119.1 septum formation initiator family protein [Lachnospiraceae bacterium]
MARKAAYRKRRQNRFGMFLVSLVVVMLLIVVAFNSIGLMAKKASYQQKEATLEEQIASELERAQEIEEFEKYTHTKKYIEEVARDKLGLVYEGEILFEDEN